MEYQVYISAIIDIKYISILLHGAWHMKTQKKET